MELLRKNLLGILLLLGAAIVLLFRYQSSQNQYQQVQIYGINEGGSFLNVEYFTENVWEPYSVYFQDTLINLVIFVDPMVECPGSIFEAELWSEIAHRTNVSIFKPTIFIPSSTPKDVVSAFRETFVLNSDDIKYYDSQDTLALYGKQGLFKVCWSLEDGYLWCEHGSASPIRQKNTRRRLETLVLPLMNQFEQARQNL